MSQFSNDFDVAACDTWLNGLITEYLTYPDHPDWPVALATVEWLRKRKEPEPLDAPQPTMEALRARLSDTNALARMEQMFAELHARDCGFPTLADADFPDLHARFAKSCMLVVHGAGNEGLAEFVSASLSMGGHE